MAQRAERRVARRRRGGVSLWQFRTEARRTVEEVAEYLDCSPWRVRQLEIGYATLRTAEARDMLDLYGVAGEPREAFLRVVDQMRERNWWYPYADIIDGTFETQLILEDEAAVIRTHQANLVPGLLQTERYAWELIATLGDLPLDVVKRRAALRIARQQVLTRNDAPHLAVILDEAALRRPVGSAEVMREQYLRLAEIANTPTITVQILPFQAGPLRSMGFAFHIFEFLDSDPQVVELELLDRVHFAEESEEVSHYVAAFEETSLRALDPDRSRRFLAELAARS